MSRENKKKEKEKKNRGESAPVGNFDHSAERGPDLRGLNLHT